MPATAAATAFPITATIGAAGCLIGAALVLAGWPARPIRVARPARPAGPLRLAWPAARWRPTGRVALGACSVGAGCVAGLAAGPVAAVLATVSTTLAARHVRTSRAERAAAAGRSGEIEALAALGAELRSGRQPVGALAAVEAPGGLGAALAAARAAAALGGDVAAAVRRDAPAGGVQQRLAAAWQVSELTGAPLAAVVDRVEADARSAAGVRQHAHVELAGARATGGLLAALPALGVGLGQAMGAHPVRVLLHTPLGALCAGCGLALEVAGLAWIGRLTRTAIGP